MLILDRYEETGAGAFGVVETDKGFENFARVRFAKDVREGDVITEVDGIFVRDTAATDLRRARIADKLQRLVK